MDIKPNIFNYIDYSVYLNKTVIVNSGIYGYKALLAEAAGCQRSYISQVLSGRVHLTAEHAAGLGIFWQLSNLERDYLLNLVLLARAGTKPLKDLLRAKIQTARQDQENLTKRISEKTVLPEANASIFYSNWYYLAITIILTIPGYRTPKVIAERLSVKEATIKLALSDLENLGVVIRSGSEWLPTSDTIHVPRESKYNTLNHSHWRNLAVQNAFSNDNEAVHYTSVCSLSLSDANKIKELVFSLIDQSRKIVTPSREEELYCLTCDWFKV